MNDDGHLKGDEIAFFCVNRKGCDGKHHKRKLSINIKTDRFNCWVCCWGGGSLLPMLSRLGNNDADYIQYAEEHTRKPKIEVDRSYDKLKLPEEFQALSNDDSSLYAKQALGYLIHRGVTIDDVEERRIGFCSSGKYRDRVMIPSFDENGDLNFFVGRDIWGSASKPPYLSGHFNKDIIFNDLLVDWRKPVTLVEGPFDAIKAGTNAIALQGKVPSDRLISKIVSYEPRVYVALDVDAFDASLEIANRLVCSGIETFVVEFPPGIKDPGECTQEKFNRIRDMSRPLTNDFDVLRWHVQHSASDGYNA